jgi:hypothetical protein
MNVAPQPEHGFDGARALEAILGSRPKSSALLGNNEILVGIDQSGAENSLV